MCAGPHCLELIASLALGLSGLERQAVQSDVTCHSSSLGNGGLIPEHREAGCNHPPLCEVGDVKRILESEEFKTNVLAPPPLVPFPAR